MHRSEENIDRLLSISTLVVFEAESVAEPRVHLLSSAGWRVCSWELPIAAQYWVHRRGVTSCFSVEELEISFQLLLQQKLLPTEPSPQPRDGSILSVQVDRYIVSILRYCKCASGYIVSVLIYCKHKSRYIVSILMYSKCTSRYIVSILI